MSAHALWVAVAIAAQAPTETPDDWKRDLRAAAAAIEASDFAKAEALLVQVARASQALDDDDRRQIAPLERLAHFYLTDEIRRPADAEPLLRRVLTVQEHTGGLESPELADTLILLAACRLRVDPDDGKEAERLAQRALSITEKACGKEDRCTARVLQTLATTHIHRKQYEQAERALERAIAIRDKAHVPNDLELADLLDGLGDLHFLLMFERELPADIRLTLKQQEGHEPLEQRLEQRGRLINSYYMRALAIREKALGPDSDVIADRLKSLALSAAFSGRPADVESYFARWLAIYERTKHEPSEEQAGILCECGDAAAQQKHWPDAERWFARAQSAIEQLKGANSDEFASTLERRAEAALENERFDDAESFLKRALAIRSRLPGHGNVNVRQVREFLAGSYRDYARDSEAFRFWVTLAGCATRLREPATADSDLSWILDTYLAILCRTNHVVPQPGEADLAYLRKIGAVLPGRRCQDLITLKTLDLSTNIGPADLPHIARLYSLENISLVNQEITDDNLKYIETLICLRQLKLEFGQITNAGLKRIGRLTNLEELELGFTAITDAGLANLGSLRKLQSLVLTGTKIGDAGLDHIRSLPSLEYLDIHRTKVSPAAVERLKRERPGLTIVYRSAFDGARRHKPLFGGSPVPSRLTPLIFPIEPNSPSSRLPRESNHSESPPGSTTGAQP